MRDDTLRAQRLRSHLLSTPAATATDAAAHLLATQAQEFWAGRWALAARADGAPTLTDVDAAFERGDLVRTWTQRGTLHIVPAADLPWVLEVTADRQQRAAAGVLRTHGIAPEDVDRAERLVGPALAGGNRLTRSEFADVLRAGGVDPARSRGNHILSALAVRGSLALGPVVPRVDGPTRDQYLVATGDLPTARAVAHPLAEMFVAYVRSHGPATVDDFRWWAGLPSGQARLARDAAGERVTAVDEGVFVAGDTVEASGSAAGGVRALGPFDEYYLSYADRSGVCDPAAFASIGPTLNGQVKPVIVADGRVVGVWSHSTAAGRHHLPPQPALFDGESVPPDEVDAALARFSRFLAG